MALKSPEPVHLGQSKSKNVKRIPIFYLDDVEYTIPEYISPRVFLKYMWDKRSGSEFSDLDLLVSVLGEDAYRALMNYESLTKEEWSQITEIIKEYAAGAVEDSAKN